MLFRTQFAAFFLILSQLFLLHAAQAHSSDISAQPSAINPVDPAQFSATSADAIQQFVRADFSGRRDMLNNWPASIEELDKLVTYIDQNQNGTHDTKEL